MAVKDRVTIELYVDDQGTIQIVNARKAVEDLGAAGKQSQQDAASGADEFAGALVRQLGIYALLTGALYELKHLTVDTFAAGKQEINDYNIQAISAAANLTNRTVVGLDQQTAAYGQYKSYVLGMYDAFAEETVRHFSSQRDMIGTFNTLARMGIQSSKEEAGAIGVITDQVRLLNGGELNQLSMQHEMYGLLQGYSGMHYRLAQDIEQRLGPAWHDLVVQHMKAGDLLTWMGTLYPGLAVAAGDIQAQLTAQRTTLDTLIRQVGREGLEGAYESHVGFLVQINDFLRMHREEIGGGIARGWTAVQDLVKGTLGALQIIGAIVATPVVWSITIATAVIGPGASFLASGAQGGTYKAGGLPGDPNRDVMVTIPPTPDFGFGALGADTGQMLADQEQHTNVSIKKYFKDTTSTFIEEQARQNQYLQKFVKGRLPAIADIPDNSYATGLLKNTQAADIGLGVDSLPDFMRSGLPPATKLPNLEGAGGGAGKSTEGAENRLASMMAQLQQEFAQLTQGKEASLMGWVDKEMTLLDQLAAKGVDVSQARVQVWENSAAKLGKIDEDFNLKFAAGNVGVFQKLNDQYDKDLRDWGTTQTKKDVIYSDYQKKWLDTEDKFQAEWLGMQKSSFDALAQATPVLSDQLALKLRSFDIEAKLKQVQDDKKLRELQLNGIITEGQAQEMQGLLALEAAQKRFNLEMENDQGLSGWAYGRAKEADKNSTVKEMMGGLESGFQNAFSSGLQGVLAHDQSSLKKIGATMWQGLIGEINKQSITGLFSSGAKLYRQWQGQGPSAGAGGGGLTSYTADNGRQLSQAATGLNKASAGFNLNYAQFGLAAGGLALSGIGILTHSQFLVTAGTVLQMAGMAIQLYEALTATTVTTEYTASAAALSESAGSLYGSAVALNSAAAALGGSGGGGMFGGLLGSIPLIGSFFGGGGGVAAGAGLGSLGGWGEAMMAIPLVLHSGGHLQPIYAHAGWPALGPHEVPFIGLDSERVLNPQETIDYEAGMRAGGGPGGGYSAGGGSREIHIHDNSTIILPPGADVGDFKAALREHRQELLRMVDIESGRSGQSPLSPRR